MTTQTPSNACDNCGDPVKVRRPSESGKHWCQRSQCRAARQRFYYSRKASTAAARAEGETLEALRLALMTALSSRLSIADPCPECGRTDALDGWVHPAPGWSKVCLGTGSLGNERSMQPYYQRIWAADCPL